MRTIPFTLFGQHPLTLLVPDSPVEQAQGLLGSPPLRDDQAMVFFNPVDLVRLHTVGMAFPIDVLWLTPDWKTLVAFDEFVPPGVQLLQPKSQLALELAAGWWQRHGLVPNPLPMGDWVAGMTSRVGIKPCPPCKRRQQAMNEFGNKIARFWRR